MVPGLKTTAYRVSKAYAILLNGTTASLTLTGSNPTVPYRCKVKISGTYCAGTLSVNAEVLTFVQAGTKITSSILTALPTITSSGLTCNVIIEAVDIAGAPIITLTLIPFLCRWIDSTEMFIGPGGIWTQSLAQVLTTDTNCTPETDIVYLGVTYTVRKVVAFAKLSGREFLRRLFL